MTQDDAMCVKSSEHGTPVSNVSFLSNTVYSSCGGAKFGMQAEAAMTNAVFANHAVVHARRGVVVEATEGTATMSNLLFKHIHLDNIESTTSETGETFAAEPMAISTKCARIVNVTLDHVVFAQPVAAMAGKSHVRCSCTVELVNARHRSHATHRWYAKVCIPPNTSLTCKCVHANVIHKGRSKIEGYSSAANVDGVHLQSVYAGAVKVMSASLGNIEIEKKYTDGITFA